MTDEEKAVINLIRDHKRVYKEYPTFLAVPKDVYKKLKHKRFYFMEAIEGLNMLDAIAFNNVSFVAPASVEITAE